jgi:hypothetical protein
MTVGSVSSSSTYASAIRPQAEAAEVQRAGRDTRNDGDAGEGGAAAVKAPAPTVNLAGQMVGSRINVTA